jgi:ribonucleoside-diphosphate reductase alpha chain
MGSKMSIRDYLSEERKQLQKEGLVPEWMSTDGWGLFKSKYSVKGEQAFYGRARTIAITAAQYTENPPEWESKFFDLIWKGWLSCSTPVLANMGTTRGMSVSCSGQFIGDSVDQFYTNLHEAAMLSKYGFGTSGYLGDIRGRGAPISVGGEASGTLPVFQDFVNMSRKVSQGSSRRGAWAGYLPVAHKDFDELADFVKEFPDDANLGWNWSDQDTALANDGDPETIRKFKKILKLKMLAGKGYLFFPDKVNRRSPQMYKDLGLTVKSSNLCTEITLHQDEDHTYTCVLSSMNLNFRDDWKDTDAVFNATVFLDCVAEDFIRKAEPIPAFRKAVNFTKKSRALGLGVCGFHTYLQKKMIPIESLEALWVNKEIFKDIKENAVRASKWMATHPHYGQPEWCKGYGVRNTHLLAVAPTMSTALIMGGVSQGIEPIIGNAFIQASAGGESERINPVFLDLMKKRGKYTRKLVRDIADKHGSVQHLDWLTDDERLVFRTAFEVSQESLLRLASQRQEFICQAQSLNLFFSAEEAEGYIAKVHKMAIEDPMILSLYYVRTQAGVAASSGECVACQ